MIRTGLLALVAIAAPASGSIVLDTFDNIPGDDAGGPRTLTSMEEFNTFGVGTFDAFVDTGAGAFFFASDPGVGGSADILWDNNGAGLNLDAAALMIDGFELDFATIDQEMPLSIWLRSGNGSLATVVLPVSASFSPQTVSVSLASFNDQGGFDASDVDSIQIFFPYGREAIDSLDFVLTEFRATVVPAPASVALLGLAGLATRRRR